MRRIFPLILIGLGSFANAADTAKVKLSQETMRNLIVRAVDPQYPPEAGGLEGPVVVRTVISADGSILAAEPRCGYPKLESAAVDTVRKWEFRPAAVNGRTVEVSGNVVVDFEPPNPAANSTILHVKSQAALANLLASYPPMYPTDAAFAKIQGCVVVKSLIGTDGKVRAADPVSGHPMLLRAAQVAAAQSRYTPFTKDGAVVEAETYQIVNFSLRK